MSALLPYSIGPEQLFFVKEESSWNTWLAWTGADAMNVLKTTFKPDQKRENRADTRNTRSLLERHSMRKNVDWSVESYLCGSGTAGTAPDCAPFLKALFGTETTSAGSYVEWSLAQSQLPTSLQLVRQNEVFQQVLQGCAASRLTLESGGGPIKMTVEGKAVWQKWMNAIPLCSGTNGTTAVTAGASDLASQVDTNTICQLDDAGTIDDGADNDGLRVTDVTGAGITVDSNLDNDHTASVLEPWRPTCSTLGSEATDLVGHLTLGGGELDLVSWKLVLDNNMQMPNGQYGYDRAMYAYYGRRFVTLSLSIQYRRDMGFHIDDARNFTSSGALEIIAGSDSSGSGDQYQISGNAVELDFIPPETPEPESTDVAKLAATGVILASSSGEDELTMRCW